MGGALTCRLERTRRIGVLAARVRDDAERLVALATGSFYISELRA